MVSEQSVIPTVVTTLCLVRKDNRVLLGFKKRGFGAEKWNGFGGKVKVGETIEAAAYRELKEEAGIDAHALLKRGLITFHFYNQGEGKDWNLLMHTFLVHEWRGEVRESDEMRPKWYDIDKIPFHLMWADDAYWMPQVLEGKKISATFYFPTLEMFDKYEVIIYNDVDK